MRARTLRSHFPSRVLCTYGSVANGGRAFKASFGRELGWLVERFNAGNAVCYFFVVFVVHGSPAQEEINVERFTVRGP